jgi:RNA polymerase sigma-70 factor (ECF subfamily)
MDTPELPENPGLSAEAASRQWLARAREGDRTAFDDLARASLKRLRAVIRRMVGDASETDDLVQDTLLRAWTSLERFRGEAQFSTWLCAIGVRLAIDHLRSQRRWREEAQLVYANECASSPELGAEVAGAYATPEFIYQAKEHIAYCFVCVGRSLLPEEQAALVLREVMGMSEAEAARALEVTGSVFRHHLARARLEMTRTFDGLCALVNQSGPCWQCKGLRDFAPPDRRGEPIPSMDTFDSRLRLVAQADIDTGRSQALHDLFWARTRALEAVGHGSVRSDVECGGADAQA